MQPTDLFSVLKRMCLHHKHIRFFAKSEFQRLGGSIPSPRALASLLSNETWDLYIHLNPSDSPRYTPKASSSEITHLTNILLDLDPVMSSASLSDAIDSALRQGDELLKGSGNAATIVYSGRGMQAWIPIEPTLLSLPDQRLSIERATNAFLRRIDVSEYGCRIDTSCSDLARVARLPGSTNQKSKTHATLVKEGSGERIPVGELLKLDPGESRKIRSQLNEKTRTYFPFILPHLTARAVTFLTQGVTSPGRHAAAYAAARSLYELSVPFETAETWVIKGGSLCDPPLSPSDSARALRNAYSKS